MVPKLASLDHLVLTVADLAATLGFYCGVLGCEEVTFAGGRKALGFGQQKINLHVRGAEFEPKAEHPTAGSGDLCFLSVTPLADWQAHLIAHGIVIEEGPVRRTGATGPILSIYCRDPDGNLIEIANALAA